MVTYTTRAGIGEDAPHAVDAKDRHVSRGEESLLVQATTRQYLDQADESAGDSDLRRMQLTHQSPTIAWRQSVVIRVNDAQAGSR